MENFTLISQLSNYITTKLPAQHGKTDYMLDPNVGKEEQLQRTLHNLVRTEFLSLTRNFVSNIEKTIVSDDGATLLCTDKNEDEIITEAAKFIISSIFQGRRSIVYVTEDSSSNKDDVDKHQVITTIQTAFPTDAQLRDCIHQQCRKRVNNKNANDKLKTKKLKNGKQIVRKIEGEEEDQIDSDNEKEIQS